MKKIFAFAIALVSMAVSMTSCNNDEADFIEQPAPKSEVHNTPKEEKFDGNIYLAATADQLQYFNNEFTISVNGKAEQVNINELPTTTNVPSMILEHLPANQPMPTFFVYRIPANTKGDLKVNGSITVKEGVELPETVDLAVGASTALSNNISLMPGLKSEKVDSFLSRKCSLDFLNTVLK